MFEVGDRVRIDVPGDQIHGLVGVVSKVEPEKLWPVLVNFDLAGVQQFDWPFDYVELEKVND